MASTVGTNKVASNFYWAIFDHDPGSTSATVCTPDGGTTKRYVDLADYNHFAVLAMSSTLTGNGITKLEIVACADTDFSSVTAVKDSSTVAADAVEILFSRNALPKKWCSSGRLFDTWPPVSPARMQLTRLWFRIWHSRNSRLTA